MIINDAIGVESNMIFGAVVDEDMKDQAMITVIATGIRGTKKKADREAPRAKESVPAKLTPRRPAPRTHERPRPEPPQPDVGGAMYAKEPRRNSRRELEIPTFLRRQMD
ncbi:MAG: hypothetical protein KAW67_05235, partial [Candidatus Eisenbacteria sp.]|nr:hypothetical protein [Candidatus Eisenbacteria bacterium]